MAKKIAAAQKTWFQLLLIESFVPVLLMVLTPCFLITYIHFAVECRSNLSSAIGKGVIPYLNRIVSQVNFTDVGCWQVVLSFAAWSAIVPLIIGGKIFYGPPTNSGHRPVYIDSAFRYYILSSVVFGGILLAVPGIAWTWYLKLLPLTCTTVLFGFLCSVSFFIKGLVSPSPGEYTSTGNILFDFYWGKELYPRIGRYWDLKEWAIVFYGMFGWFAMVLLCWKAQYEQIGWNWPMATSTITLAIYMAKFFWWYYGYTHSLDIIHDRTGFYLGWGGLGLMPPLLSCNAVYMVENPSDVGPASCLIMLVLALVFIVLTYWADMQRLWVRQSNGKCNVWMRPPRFVGATFKNDKGNIQESLLLASGFWGIARHPNYVLEYIANLLWMFPAKLDSLVPYLWGIFLLGILMQRIGRDDNRCRKKYGKYWDEYCKIVPYRLIPGIL